MIDITCSSSLEKEFRRQVTNLTVAIRKMLHYINAFQAATGGRAPKAFALYFENAKAEVDQFDISDREIVNSVTDKAIELEKMSEAFLAHCRLCNLRRSPAETIAANVVCLGSRQVH